MEKDAGLKVLQLENTAQIAQNVREKLRYNSDSSKESAAALRIPKIR